MLNAIKAIEDIPTLDRRDAAILADGIVNDMIAAPFDGLFDGGES
jgi:hypothetical protein